MCMHIFEWKTHQDRRWSAYLHFLETLPSWSLSERQIMVATPTSHMIRFGPLTFRPVKGKKTNKWTVALVLNDWNDTSVLHSNFEMETSHVVTHMIFHAITADQNARIRVLHRWVSGKSTGKSVCAKSYDRQNEARGWHRSPHWI